MTTQQFNKLPRPERAIIVCKDVIKQIRAGLYRTGQCGYSTNFLPDKKLKNIDDSKQASEVMKENKGEIVCEGCARASLFISLIKYKNDISVRDALEPGFDYGYINVYGKKIKDGESTKYLSREFSLRQQALIENAYEDSTSYGRHISDENSWYKQRIKAKQFNDKWDIVYEKSNSIKLSKKNYILVKICENIIKNNGTFKP